MGVEGDMVVANSIILLGSIIDQARNLVSLDMPVSEIEEI